MAEETQEQTRDQTVACAVTTQEKWYLQLVAKQQKRPLSDLVREYALSDLIARGERINDALEGVGAGVSS